MAHALPRFRTFLAPALLHSAFRGEEDSTGALADALLGFNLFTHPAVLRHLRYDGISDLGLIQLHAHHDYAPILLAAYIGENGAGDLTLEINGVSIAIDDDEALQVVGTIERKTAHGAAWGEIGFFGPSTSLQPGEEAMQ